VHPHERFLGRSLFLVVELAVAVSIESLHDLGVIRMSTWRRTLGASTFRSTAFWRASLGWTTFRPTLPLAATFARLHPFKRFASGVLLGVVELAVAVAIKSLDDLGLVGSAGWSSVGFVSSDGNGRPPENRHRRDSVYQICFHRQIILCRCWERGHTSSRRTGLARRDCRHRRSNPDASREFRRFGEYGWNRGRLPSESGC
jgi:hypothetical protein